MFQLFMRKIRSLFPVASEATPESVTRLVWDTSAILNVGDLNSEGYSPANSLYKDQSGWQSGTYQNIYPSLAIYEVVASVSRRERTSETELGREFWVYDEDSIIYPVDSDLIQKSRSLFYTEGFNKLRGADLVFACIAHVENAILVTKDNHFDSLKEKITVLNLNESMHEAKYRALFENSSNKGI